MSHVLRGEALVFEVDGARLVDGIDVEVAAGEVLALDGAERRRQVDAAPTARGRARCRRAARSSSAAGRSPGLGTRSARGSAR